MFSTAQNFSGEIQYKIEIIPKIKSLNIDSLISSKKGGLAKYLITSNFYKSTHFDKGEKSYTYTYDNISKRMYDEYPDKPYITYRTATAPAIFLIVVDGLASLNLSRPDCVIYVLVPR